MPPPPHLLQEKEKNSYSLPLEEEGEEKNSPGTDLLYRMDLRTFWIGIVCGCVSSKFPSCSFPHLCLAPFTVYLQ